VLVALLGALVADVSVLGAIADGPDHGGRKP